MDKHCDGVTGLDGAQRKLYLDKMVNVDKYGLTGCDGVESRIT